MFSDVIKALPTNEMRRDAIRAFLIGEIDAKRFRITPLLMETEPFRTLGLEVMDGIVVDSGKPQYGATEILTERPEVKDAPVRLIAIRNDGAGGLAYDPNGHVIVRRTSNVTIPGTSKSKRVVQDVKLGSDVKLSHREARLVLHHHGWPMKDDRSEGNRLGTVVEWEWLKVAVKLPTVTQPEIDLHASIRDAIEAPKNEAPPSKSTRAA